MLSFWLRESRSAGRGDGALLSSSFRCSGTLTRRRIFARILVVITFVILVLRLSFVKTALSCCLGSALCYCELNIFVRLSSNSDFCLIVCSQNPWFCFRAHGNRCCPLFWCLGAHTTNCFRSARYLKVKLSPFLDVDGDSLPRG
jgi:hypothetical protein